MLLIACAASALAMVGLGDPARVLVADPQLAFLLRGMALIKGGLVTAAFAVLWWRFGHPLPAWTAVAYIAGAAAVSGASVLIWQLSCIPAAAIVFHVAAFVLLVTAWRDRGDIVGRNAARCARRRGQRWFAGRAPGGVPLDSPSRMPS